MLLHLLLANIGLRPPEIIADATLCHDVFRVAGIVLKFFPEPSYGNVYGTDVSVIFVAPHLLEQLFS